MNAYQVIPFDRAHISLLPRGQEPFDVIGQLAVRYDGAAWQTGEILLEEPRQKTYPNDLFDPEEFLSNPNSAAFLAMQDEICVGSLRVCLRWNGDAFIDDLAVDRAHRGRGVGHLLMDAVVCWARGRGLTRISLETQDNNLLACRFYLGYGFRLGGIDCCSYIHPSYIGETALYFYLPLQEDVK